MKMQQCYSFYLGLFIIAIIANVIFFKLFLSHNPCLLLYDSAHYHEGAWGLFKRCSYVGHDGNFLFHRLPGYPFFLALGYLLSNGQVWGALLLQLILTATIPILIYHVVFLLILKEELAGITACLSVITPAFMIFSGLVMSEILSTWLFLIFLLMFLRAIDFPKQKLNIIFAGILLGAMSLVRPVGHLLLPFVLLYIMLFFKESLFHRIKSCFIFAMSWLCIVGGWLLRNFLLTGYLFFHTLPGPHFINHVAIRLVATGENISYALAKQKVYAQLPEQEIALSKKLGRSLQEIEIVQLQENLTKRIIWQYPWQFCKLVAINCFKTMFSLYSSELLVIDAKGELPSYDRSSLWEAAKRFLFPTVHNQKIIGVIYFELGLLLLTLIGVGIAVFHFWRYVFHQRVVLVLGLIGFFVGISLACGYARLRIAVEPFYLLSAAYALQNIWDWYKRTFIVKGLFFQ